MEHTLLPCPFCGNTDLRVDKCTKKITCKKCFVKNPVISRFISDETDEAGEIEEMFCYT